MHPHEHSRMSTPTYVHTLILNAPRHSTTFKHVFMQTHTLMPHRHMRLQSHLCQILTHLTPTFSYSQILPDTFIHIHSFPLHSHTHALKVHTHIDSHTRHTHISTHVLTFGDTYTCKFTQTHLFYTDTHTKSH